MDYSEDQEDREAAGEPWVPPYGSDYWRAGGELVIYGSTLIPEAIQYTEKYIGELELSIRANPKLMRAHPEIAENTRRRIAGCRRAISVYQRKAAAGLRYVNMPNDWTAEMFDDYLVARNGQPTANPPIAPRRDLTPQEWQQETGA